MKKSKSPEVTVDQSDPVVQSVKSEFIPGQTRPRGSVIDQDIYEYMQPTLIQPSHGNRETFSVSRLFKLTSMSLRNKQENCKLNSVSLFHPLTSFPLGNNEGSFMNPITHQARSSHKNKLDSEGNLRQMNIAKAKNKLIYWLTNPNWFRIKEYCGDNVWGGNICS